MTRDARPVRRLLRTVGPAGPEDILYRATGPAAVGAAVISLNWHTLRVNEEFCRITGYAEHELLGMRFTDANIPPPDARAHEEGVDPSEPSRIAGRCPNLFDKAASTVATPVSIESSADDPEPVPPLRPGRRMTLTPPEWRKVEEAQLGPLCGTGAPVRYEKELLRKDGSRVPVEVLVHLVASEGRAPSCYYAFVTDLTERHRVEEELAASEARFSKLFENMLEGVAYCEMVFDAEGRPVDWVYLAVNAAFERLTGLTGVVGRRVTEILPDIRGDHPEVLERYGRVASTGRPDSFDVDFKPLQMWLNISAFSPARGRFVAVFEDVTERRRSEAALRDSEEKYRQLFEVESGAIVLVDAETMRFVDVNRSAEKLYGWTKGEFLTMTAPDLSAETAETAATLAQAARGDLQWIPLRFHRRKSGEIFPVEISAGTFTLRDRRIICAVSRDITERVKSSLALTDYQKRLRSMASEKLLSEERERRRIAVGLHDQIGQSLTLVCMRIEKLAETAGDPQAKDELRQVLETTREALRATRNLTFELSPQILYEFGLAPAVGALGRELQQRHGIRFSAECPTPLPPLGKDALILLYQTLRELLMNVVKHSRASACRTTFATCDDRLVISVEDDGMGFDVETARSQSGERRGFGLFSVQERLKELGGGMEIESRPSRGTLVTLWVPRAQDGLETRGEQHDPRPAG